jgi:NitT/TauT family transport system permease protein
VQTASAVHTIDRQYIWAAENFGVSRAKLFLEVVIPAALPQIIVGMRVSLGVAWLVVVAAEMIATAIRTRLPHHRLAQRR